MKKLPIGFFNKPRPNIMDVISKQKKDPDNEIIPFNWSKEVLSGKFKDKVILDLPKKTL